MRQTLRNQAFCLRVQVGIGRLRAVGGQPDLLRPRREPIEPLFRLVLSSTLPLSDENHLFGKWDPEPVSETASTARQRVWCTEGASMGRRLYVGNLPYTTGESELQELFSRAGNVESVRVMRDAATGRARGFAFVEMSTDEEAQKAATEFNQFQMGGRSLTVNEARPKPEGGFGGGGGFGGNRGGGGGRREPRW